MSNLPPNKQGVWIRSENTFYYLETGPQKVLNEVDRLRSILLNRGFKLFNTTKDGASEPAPYLILTAKEAKEKQYKESVIYLNDHVRSVVEAEQAKASKGWA
jgi:hypothetical protein